MRFFLPLILVVWALYFTSCEKPTLQNTSLLPEDNLVLHFTDTLTIKAQTLRESKISVNNLLRIAVGVMKDPVFGTTTANFYSQFYLPSTNLDFDSVSTVDSVYLSLNFDSYYGDKSSSQIFEVYELDQQIDDDTTYYSNQTFSDNGQLIGQFTFDPNVEEINSEIKILLSSSLGDRLLSADSTVLSSDAEFQNFFKGLFVKSSSTNGKGIAFFDIQFSNLVLVYNDSINVKFSLIKIVGNSASFGTVNHYEHNYQGTAIQAQLDANLDDNDSIFIQGLAGLNAKITIPYFSNLGRILINKAELVLTPTNGSLQSTYLIPAAIAPRIDTVDATFRVEEIWDIPSSDGDSTDGMYAMNLAQHFQQKLDDALTLGREEDFGIFILPIIKERQNNDWNPFERNYFANRVVLGGGNHADYRMKLNLTYTIIDTSR